MASNELSKIEDELRRIREALERQSPPPKEPRDPKEPKKPRRATIL